MRARKLLLASISLLCINTSVYGEEWGLVRCLKECTNVSCTDATKKETCQTNCANNLGSIDACVKAKPGASSPQATRPTPPPRRGLPSSPQQVQPSSGEPVSKGAEEQTQSATNTGAPTGRPQARRFSKPPVLEQEPSTVETLELKKQPSESKGPQRPAQSVPTLQKQPSQHHGTGTDKKTAMAEQILALNEGRGVKVKHMKEKLEGLENLVEALQKRIGLMEPLADNLQGVQETLKMLQQNTGFDKPEIRNDPEHDIEYKPEQFSAASSASSTLDGTSCQAVLTKVQQKTKETKDKTKSKELSVLGNLLTEMCARTKNLNRIPAQKVQDAEAVNKAFSNAKRLF